MKSTSAPLGGLSRPLIPVTQPKLTGCDGFYCPHDGGGGFGQTPYRRAIPTRAKPAKPRHQRYDAGNGEAARIIMSDPTRYEGLPQIWARMFFGTFREGE